MSSTLVYSSLGMFVTARLVFHRTLKSFPASLFYDYSVSDGYVVLPGSLFWFYFYLSYPLYFLTVFQWFDADAAPIHAGSALRQA